LTCPPVQIVELDPKLQRSCVLASMSFPNLPVEMSIWGRIQSK
jgi:hypothetical protein